METLKTQVQHVLQQELSPKAILLYSLENGIVGGWVASKVFNGLSDGERVQKLLKLFEKYFNAERRRHIGAILPLTPLEKKILIDEDENGVTSAPPKASPSLKTVATLKVRRRNGHMRPKSKLRSAK